MAASEEVSPDHARISSAMAAWLVRILTPLRCHLYTVTSRCGTITDDPTFGCNVCLEARCLLAELHGSKRRRRARHTGGNL